MKKIFTLFTLACTGFSLAQSTFHLLDPENGYLNVTNSTLDYYTSSGIDLVKELEVKNTASSSKTVKMKRTFVSGVYTTLPDQDTVEICWNLCLSPTWGTTQTAGNVNIAAGDTASFSGNGIGFHAAFKPCMLMGTRVVRYTFWDLNNSSDSVMVIVNYHVTGVGIAESNLKSFSFSSPVPNPASGNTVVKYDFPSQAKTKIQIYNAVGGLVKEYKIEDQSGKLSINTDELSNGVYFYSLLVNDKVVGTKKLIVSH